jgi:hypothetical protein
MERDKDILAEIDRLRAENDRLRKKTQRRSNPTVRPAPPPSQQPASDSPMDLMIAALDVEVAAVKKKGGSTSIDLTGGVLASSSNNGYIYRFPFSDVLDLRDDTPIKVQFGQLEANGVIVSAGNGVIVLSLEEDLGPRLPRVRLVGDDSFLLERLLQRLQQVRSKEVSFNTESALRILGKAVRVNTFETPGSLIY